MNLIKKFMATPRVRHCTIAILLAMAAAFLTLLRPLDITLWSLEAKLFNSEPSGSILLVTDETGAAGNSVVEANTLLDAAIRNADKAGAERIVIDTPLRLSNDPAQDAQLRDAIRDLGARAVIAAPVDQEIYESSLRQSNAEFFTGSAKIASSDVLTDFLDFVWAVEPSYSSLTREYPALWTILAPSADTARRIHPDYTFKSRDIPAVDISRLAQGDEAALAKVRGRQLVIGALDGDERKIQMPGGDRRIHSSADIHIIAAETAMRGSGRFYSEWLMIAFVGGGLMLVGCLAPGRTWRRAGYGVVAAGFLAAFFAAAALGHRVMLADAMVILIAYGVMRASANYRNRHLFLDAQSRLPNFTAFRRHLEAQGALADHVLVVVKIARLDAIFATLKGSQQGEYLRAVASRLALGESSAMVFHDGGKYLGMVFRRSDYADLQGHLEGLRAIAGQAVSVDGEPIDVAITIGVDQSLDGDAANRISSAIAAADQAREAYRPVFIISDFQADSEEWDHSLQSRL